jgi:hypothetical protein
MVPTTRLWQCPIGHRLPAPGSTGGCAEHKAEIASRKHGERRSRNVAQGRRRIVPLTGGKFSGPELNGTLLPGASADWQIVLPDGTALGDIRFTLQTDRGDLLYVRSQGVRHGRAEVLARLSRAEEVDATDYVFRTSTQIETAAPDFDWLNKGVFISVAGRQVGGVIYEVYLVG